MELEWHKHFDERQLKEIAFSRHYARHYAHGTDGHNAKIIIAKFADLMDEAELGHAPEIAVPEEEFKKLGAASH